MLADARISTLLRTTIAAIDVPPAPVQEIRAKMRREPLRPARGRYVAVAAAAAVALAIVAFPRESFGVVESMEAKIAQILHWVPPPPPPKSVTDKMVTREVSLSEAQARAGFTVVSPAGLPPDVVRQTISMAPTGVYDTQARAWRSGPPAVGFQYWRRDGRSFVLLAHRADPHEPAPSKFVYEDMGGPGKLVLIKRELFVWRNGNQTMQIAAGDAISAREIVAIRTAMHGTAVATVDTPRASRSKTDVMYKIP
ncbi:MAG: hypothetical protein JOZ38_04380 [Candidatus Eremiobacteraeota bacterium]|nr:hypothetical protein [Candidatus Eremiobacteraeota bacterium]